MAARLTTDDVLRCLEDATQSAPGSLAPSTDLATVDGWDSMGMVMFMGIVTERTGIELSVQDFRTATSPAAIAELIAQRF